MVMGEPGVAKTALCEGLRPYVAERCGYAQVGHRYERGAFALSCLPFVEAFRSYVSQMSPTSPAGN